MNSLDPRVNRLDLEKAKQGEELKEKEFWQTYEVFHQKKRGAQHVHVGTVHAPDPEIALVFAKEQYARRMQCVNLWVAPTAEIFTFSYEDDDMFATTPEKKHRDPSAYRVRDKITAFKQRNSKD